MRWLGIWKGTRPATANFIAPHMMIPAGQHVAKNHGHIQEQEENTLAHSYFGMITLTELCLYPRSGLGLWQGRQVWSLHKDLRRLQPWVTSNTDSAICINTRKNSLNSTIITDTCVLGCPRCSKILQWKAPEAGFQVWKQKSNQQYHHFLEEGFVHCLEPKNQLFFAGWVVRSAGNTFLTATGYFKDPRGQQAKDDQ